MTAVSGDCREVVGVAE